MNSITIPALNDMHVHFRELEQAPGFADCSAQYCDHVLMMPNTKEPLQTAQLASGYQDYVREFAFPKGLNVLGTLYLNEQTTPFEIVEAVRQGIFTAKVYPKGKTHGSDWGVSNYRNCYPAFEEMERQKMILSLHGEHPHVKEGHTCLEAERDFLYDIFIPIRRTFPKLKIVLEHITTMQAVDTIKNYGKDTAATITVHHPCTTIDDVIGDKLEPRNFCKPIQKYPQDREALIEAATSGDPRFFLGSDSAPHTVESKYCDHGCAGVFTAPILPQLLVEIFEKQDKLDKLPGFSNLHAAEFYNLPKTEKKITLVKRPTEVPLSYTPIQRGIQKEYPIFKGGETLSWSLQC